MAESEAWPANWRAVTLEEQAGLARALARELPLGHRLEGVSAIAIARRADQDDVLYRLSDGRFASVHLTWTVNVLPFPFVAMFTSLGAWRLSVLEEEEDDA